MGYLTVEPTELLFYSPCRWRQTKKLSLTNSGGANVAVKVKTTNDQVGCQRHPLLRESRIDQNGEDRLHAERQEDTGGQSLQTFWESERNWHKVQVILMFKPVPSRLKCPRKGAPKTTGDDKAKRAQSGKGKHTVEKTQEDRAERMHKGHTKLRKRKPEKKRRRRNEESPLRLAEIRRVFEEMKKTVVEEEENRKQESAKIEIIDDHLPDYQPADTAADEGRLKKTGEGTCGRQQDDPGNKRKERTNSKVPRKGH
uniref:Uncharacterized protein n=1 Tax=Trichuris muris TaxID=70415 RepID=A0A5S6Q563_TRIMR